MIQNNNLSEAFYESFMAIGARNCVTFLPKGDPLRSMALTGIELHEKAVEMAYRIQKRTEFLKYRKRPVLLAMSPGLDFIVTFIASLYAGITIAPIPISNNKLQQDRIKNIINDCSAREVLCDESGYEVLKGFLDFSSFKSYCITDNQDQENEIACELPGFSFKTADPAYIQYTSGSFKTPKGILLSQSNVLHNLWLAGSSWGFTEHTVSGSWLPHFHDMGLGVILVSLFHRSSVVFMSPLAFIQKPIRWLKMISDYKVTLSGAPPFAYNLCCRRITADEMQELDLSEWKSGFLGSEIVHKKVITSFQDKFSTAGLQPHSLFACYGMAEVNIFVAGEKVIKEAAKQQKAEDGLIEPCFLSEMTRRSIIIVDFMTKKLLPDGEKGEIWVQSPSLAKGYILPSIDGTMQISSTDFIETCEGANGKWFRTGDSGRIEGDKLYVFGRQKDTVKVNGLNVSAADIEWYAAEVNPNLNPAAAAAFRTSEINDDKACLLIETFSSEPMNIEEVKEQIRSKILSNFSLELEHILILKSGALDRTSSGKIRRYAISQSFHTDIYARKTLVDNP